MYAPLAVHISVGWKMYTAQLQFSKLNTIKVVTIWPCKQHTFRWVQYVNQMVWHFLQQNIKYKKEKVRPTK